VCAGRCAVEHEREHRVALGHGHRVGIEHRDSQRRGGGFAGAAATAWFLANAEGRYNEKLGFLPHFLTPMTLCEF